MKPPKINRRTSPDERKLFEQDFAENRPIRAVRKAAPPRKTNAVAGGSGLDGKTDEKLKRGQIVPGARLDLHGLTEQAAHRSLLAFLANAQRRGVKLALVITGKGNPSHENAEWMRSPHGALKEMVPRWLNEGDFAALIAGSRTAHVRHGGEGALYVYLRKGL